jgi:glutamyl-tRNA synthetase
MTNISPVVRFAPSPTGFLHIGGLRTALYNYLFAQNLGGKIILRIEDTDRKRFLEGAAESLMETFKWTGLAFDEGAGIGGDNGPYFQSKRLDIYKKFADELIKNGKAYYAFDTPERLQELREKQLSKNEQTKYDKIALTLSEDEVQKNINDSIPHVVRLNVKQGEKIIVNDLVRGEIEFDTDTVDDQILIKSDGYPTYHLANVVDDHLMGVTHVIRGEEWLSSMPKHILLYEYLGWEKPIFAHLPLLLNPDKSKLSKRQGDVAVEDYRDKGYLKEALLNFVALLGWNPGDKQEFFTMDELIKKFTINRVHKSGAVFNIEKLDWLNAEHLRNKPNDENLTMLKDELVKSPYKDLKLDDDYLLLIIEAMKPRVSFVKEFITKCPYFYEAPKDYDESVIKKRWKEDTPDQLSMLRDKIEKIDGTSKENYEEALTLTAEDLNVGKGKLIHPVRLAVSGIGTGPGVYDLLFIAGKEEVIKRINRALEIINIPDTNPGEI